MLSDSAPESAGILALARSTEVRVFRTLEAVIATLQELGFTVERLQAAPVPVAATEPDPKPAPLVVPDIALDSVPESEAAPAPVQAERLPRPSFTSPARVPVFLRLRPGVARTR